MPKPRVLLLIGGSPSHAQPYHYAELAGLLAGEGGADLRMTDDLGVLNPHALAEYAIIANYTSLMEPSAEQVAALLGAIEQGKSFLALHAATATFLNSPDYLRAVGSKFVRHDPIKGFRVEIDDAAHPITQGVTNFDIEDELYELEVDLATAHILASAEGHPLLYTRSFGRGRVHYNALGHDQRALGNPAYRRLVLQGLTWLLEPAAR